MLILRLGEPDAVLLGLDQHGGVLAIQGGQLLLVGLLHGVLLPCLGIRPERGGAALDGVCLKVDVVGEVRHHLAEQGQGVVILPVLLLGADTGGLHLLQLGDVGICHAGGRQR